MLTDRLNCFGSDFRVHSSGCGDGSWPVTYRCFTWREAVLTALYACKGWPKPTTKPRVCWDAMECRWTVTYRAVPVLYN